MEINTPCFDVTSDYAFISYSHDDKKRIMRLVDMMVSQKYNIWIDKMILPTTEWDEEISLHIQGAKVVICFITKSYLQSNDCIKEIKYALAKGIPVLAILFSGVELPAGLEMYLFNIQHIAVYENVSDENLFNKIVMCKQVNNCKLPSASTAMDTSKPASEPVRKVNIENENYENVIYIGIITVILLIAISLPIAISLLANPLSTEGKKCESLSSLEPFDGELTWNDGIPKDPHGNEYSAYANYTIADNFKYLIFSNEISVVYYLGEKYDVLAGHIVPHCTTQMGSNATVSIWGDYEDQEQVLLYSVESINKKSEPQSIKIDLTGVRYLTIKISTAPKAAIILYDFLLWS